MTVLAAVLGVAVLLSSPPPTSDADTIRIMFSVALAITVPLAATDLLLFQVYNRASAGLGRSVSGPAPETSGRIAQVATKYLGLWATFAILTIAYWLLPEYSSDFYKIFFKVAGIAVPIFLIMALPYFYLIDRRMTDPCDGYWVLGRLCLGHLPQSDDDRRKLAHHLGGWVIKGFFLPLMTVFLFNSVNWILAQPLSHAFTDIKVSVHWWVSLAFFLDVLFAFVGYSMTLRLLDSHIRSPNPLVLGWVVALVCYKPFWPQINDAFFNYRTSPTWQQWLADMPTLFTVWSGLIITLTAIYAFATVIFGLRFSNLTHRGIITDGPYRFTKHPAYVAKNIYWWMIAVPFLSSDGTERAIQASCLLLLVNVLYFVRARTEEKHLSTDPDYVAYALWMNENGIFRHMGRVIPALRYKAPAPSRTGATPA